MPRYVPAYNLRSDPDQFPEEGAERLPFGGSEVRHTFDFPHLPGEYRRLTVYVVGAVRARDGRWFLGCYHNPAEWRRGSGDVFQWRQTDPRVVATLMVHAGQDLPDELTRFLDAPLNATLPEPVPAPSARPGRHRGGESPGGSTDNSSGRWIKVTEAACVAGVEKWTITRAVDAGHLKSNGKSGPERLVCGIDLVRWTAERSNRPLAAHRDS